MVEKVKIVRIKGVCVGRKRINPIHRQVHTHIKIAKLVA